MLGTSGGLSPLAACPYPISLTAHVEKSGTGVPWDRSYEFIKSCRVHAPPVPAITKIETF